MWLAAIVCEIYVHDEINEILMKSDQMKIYSQNLKLKFYRLQLKSP